MDWLFRPCSTARGNANGSHALTTVHEERRDTIDPQSLPIGKLFAKLAARSFKLSVQHTDAVQHFVDF